MQRDVIFGRVDEDQETVARQIDKYDLLALPVVDSTGRLVGIITHDDAMDILRQEQTEDILKFGGVSPDPEADTAPYWQSTVVERLPAPDQVAAHALRRRELHVSRAQDVRVDDGQQSYPGSGVLPSAPARHRRQRRQPDGRHGHPRTGSGRDQGPRRPARAASRDGSPGSCWA